MYQGHCGEAVRAEAEAVAAEAIAAGEAGRAVAAHLEAATVEAARIDAVARAAEAAAAEESHVLRAHASRPLQLKPLTSKPGSCVRGSRPAGAARIEAADAEAACIDAGPRAIEMAGAERLWTTARNGGAEAVASRPLRLKTRIEVGVVFPEKPRALWLPTWWPLPLRPRAPGPRLRLSSEKPCAPGRTHRGRRC